MFTLIDPAKQFSKVVPVYPAMSSEGSHFSTFAPILSAVSPFVLIHATSGCVAEAQCS